MRISRKSGWCAIAAAGVLLLAQSAKAEWQEQGSWRVTAYCPCVHCCGKADGITADGTHAPTAGERVISAPKELPFGTRVWIEGVGEGVVRDRGSAVRGSHLDLYFGTHQQAVQWGVQKRRVWVWVEGAR